MSLLEKTNEWLERIRDFQEGDAIPVGLMNDPVFAEQWKTLVNDYSKLSEKFTPHYEGTCTEFLYFITETYTDDETDLKLFETGLKRAVEDYFMRRGTTVSVVVISDIIANGRRVSAYFGWTRKQSKKLANWYVRLNSEEKKRALRDFVGVRDPELERELMRGTGNNAD